MTVERGEEGRPTLHIQTCNKILAAKSHFPTKPDPSVLYASLLLCEKPNMLRGMIMTIANDVAASVIYAESDDLSHFLVQEAEKMPHAPHISASSMMMDSIMRQSRSG
ncbi:uncharacterized protein F5147DRAFT_773766 [Suillus discolor]|uniref:Uncharacterized protein n=1 Tax=Suillus discolor TaxID=1912936 RepID=A0A9P7JU16_9AGAM|nr:uncharacterized protein F5147DRAFT_773766 [Suillus discolor]KAG2108187.1 hypothetical protein F5147DRAFT_773766 [Suillus discolor]